MKFLFAVIFTLLLVSQSKAQYNYTFEVDNQKFLLKDERLYTLENNNLKQQNVKIYNVNKEDWKDDNLKTLLFDYLLKSNLSCELFKSENVIILILFNKNDLKTIYYFKNGQKVNNAENSVIDLTELFNKCMHDINWQDLNFKDKCWQPRNSEFNKFFINEIYKSGQVSFNYNPIILEGPDSHLSPAEELKKLTKKPYMGPFSKKDYQTSNLSCLIEIKGARKVNLETIQGIKSCTIIDSMLHKSGSYEMIKCLVKENVNPDTFKLKKYNDYLTAQSKTTLYIQNSYSQALTKLGENIRKVLGHPFFTTFLKNLTQQNQPGFDPEITSAEWIDNTSFAVKFKQEEFYRVIVNQEVYKIKKFNLIKNQKEIIQLLKRAVKGDKIIEVCAIQNKLFLLEGETLYHIKNDSLKFVANNIVDLNKSYLNTDKAIYIFQQNEDKTINVIQYSTASLKTQPIAFNLKRLDKTDVLNRFLEYYDQNKIGTILHWELLDNNKILKTTFDDCFIISTYESSKFNNKRISKEVHIEKLISKNWYKTFQKDPLSSPVWKILLSHNSTPYFYSDSTLFYLSPGLKKYQRIPHISLVQNLNFLNELNPSIPIDTIFTLTDSISAVKFQSEDFFRVYKTTTDTSYFPIHFGNILAFAEDKSLIYSLVRVIESKKISGIVIYSQINKHQFLSTDNSLFYYAPQKKEDGLIAIAENTKQFAGNVNFLKEAVLDKINNNDEKIKIQTSYKINKNYFDQDSVCYYEQYYSIYKFLGDSVYRVFFTSKVESKNPRFRTDTSCVNSLDTNFNFSSINISDNFFKDSSLFDNAISTYRGNNNNLKVREVILDKGEIGFVVYDQDGFSLITQIGSKRFDFKPCTELSEYKLESYPHKNLSKSYTDLTDKLLRKNNLNAKKYHIIASSKNGIVYTDKEELQCISDENFNRDQFMNLIEGSVFFLSKNAFSVMDIKKLIPEMALKFLASGTHPLSEN